ncbi:MAG: hypothetical protein ACRYFX_26330 [Janthinobacterium lividum]
MGRAAVEGSQFVQQGGGTQGFGEVAQVAALAGGPVQQVVEQAGKLAGGVAHLTGYLAQGGQVRLSGAV